jgi:hypothetical protein
MVQNLKPPPLDDNLTPLAFACKKRQDIGDSDVEDLEIVQLGSVRGLSHQRLLA